MPFRDRAGYLLVIYALMGGLILLACRSERTHVPEGGGGSELIVAAAISMKEALTEIGQKYTERTGIPVRFSFGASGVLQRQLEEGAPFDVFVASAPFIMDQLQGRELIRRGTRRAFARNRLALIAPAEAPAEIRSFADLARESVRHLAIGNPKTVPAGYYARQLLERRGLWDPCRDRLILAENARQILDYLQRREVEAAICFASDLVRQGDSVRILEYSSERDHDPILYQIAATTRSPRVEAAQQFIEQVMSPEGQGLLQRHGFLPVE
jgi:molybdate transport system substrate-binding protein